MSEKEPKPIHVVLIDDVDYFPRSAQHIEAYKILSEVYGMLWTEAYYDPTNEDIQKFALKVVRTMRRANEILGFKK